MTGILASLAGPLASSGSASSSSPLRHHYLMVQERDLDRGVDALARAGHTVGAETPTRGFCARALGGAKKAKQQQGPP